MMTYVTKTPAPHWTAPAGATLRSMTLVAFCALSSFHADPVQAESRELLLAYKETEVLRKAAETPQDMEKVLQDYLALADQGHAVSAFRIGDILYRGTLTEADENAGIAYYRLSAEGGFDTAWRSLALALLKQGRGEEARVAFDKAVETDQPNIKLHMAKAHVRGDFGRLSEPEVGIALLKELAVEDDSQAAVQLAMAYADPESDHTDFAKAAELAVPLYESGEIEQRVVYSIAERARSAAATEKDMKLVISLFEGLAQEDHPRSAFRLGNIFTRGTLTEPDPERGIDYLRQSAELGFTPAWRYLGAELLRHDRGDEARIAFDAAIEAGESGFEVILAKAHIDRKFGDASDPRVGVALLEGLAAEGDTSAQMQAAQMYANPESGLADYEKAYALAEPLVTDSNVDALWLMAGLYQNGQGVVRDYPKATELYLAAAEAGEQRGLVRAGLVEIRRGLTTRALERLTAAHADAIPDAGPALAESHVRGMFGELSDRDLGEQMIQTAVAAGDVPFVLLAMDMRKDDIRLGLEVASLLEQAEAAAEGGDPYAAEALLRFARETPDLVENPKALRRAYLDRFEDFMRPHALAQERAALMLDTMSRKDALAALRGVLAEADFETYYNTLVGVSRSDRNAYIYLVQRELAGLGVYSGRPNGMLTSSTVRSMLAFCDKNGYVDECEHGPLRGTAVRLFSASLAMQNT